MIKDIPGVMLPYERFAKFGCKALSDEELLAVILRTGTKNENVLSVSRSLLNHKKVSNSGLCGLLNLSFEDLKTIKGIGDVKAATLSCIFEIAFRMGKEEAFNKLNFSDASSVAAYYRPDMALLKREQLTAVFLDTKLNFIKDEVISVGTVNKSLMDPREIFTLALLNESVQLILLHNHPSGDVTPSRDDILATKREKQCGELLAVRLVDHIIIGGNGYFSLKEHGLL